MNFTIKSRKTGEIFSFYAPDSGGYVHLESPGRLVAQVLRFAVGRVYGEYALLWRF
jgi:hypothetical protein